MDENIDIYKRLPSYRNIKLRCGVDRYGFSNFLSNHVGYRLTPRSFADWMHGWVWDEQPNPESLHCNKMPRDITMIVRNNVEQSALLQAGFGNVLVGGLPFSYIEKQYEDRYSDSLLAFPAHSTESERVGNSMIDYLDYLYSIKSLFDNVFICIHYLDLNGPIHQGAINRGMKIIEGARPDDANCLIRMRTIFDSFRYTTSNVIGSHVLYVLYSGCNFSFSGPIYSYDESVFLANGNPHGHSSKYINSLIEMYSEKYIKNRFKKYLSDNPRSGVQDIDYAEIEIGKKNRLNKKEIIKALGWTIPSQITGYYKGAARRLLRPKY